jgi:hypothetical protein
MLDTTIPTPHLHAPAWARITTAGHGLWRVADRTGRVIGHIRAVAADGGWRFAAERLIPSARGFRRLGEFWAATEALDCLRYQR